MPLQEDYRVSLDAFQGPLDLLLFLIRRAEVDVVDIPIARITDQYLAFLREIDEIDVELAGEFLVMAASLVEIKSRMLAPRPEEPEGESRSRGERSDAEVDPRRTLVEQLLAYQRFRMAAEALRMRADEFSRRFPARSGRRELMQALQEAEVELELELEDAHAMDLADAYERILATVDFSRLGSHVVEIDDTPLALYEDDLLDRVTRASGRMALQSAFSGLDRTHRIGLFMATLELVRQRRISVRQDDIDREIEIVALAEQPESEPIPAPSA